MSKPRRKPASTAISSDLRIIGGTFGGRKLCYHGDPLTRPMKHRVREAIFNLVSTECTGRHAIDLFAGTGALGLEALSRGAVGATFIEKHVPTARVVAENMASLEVDDRSSLLTTSAFLWAKRDLAPEAAAVKSDKPVVASSSFPLPPFDTPWLVFCSPPYAFFVERQEEMLALIGTVIDRAPQGSIFLVEADGRFNFQQLPGGVAEEKGQAGWDVRTYSPAVVGVWRK